LSACFFSFDSVLSYLVCDFIDLVQQGFILIMLLVIHLFIVVSVVILSALEEY